MANTTNYGWAKPVVGGSTGAWGTLVNAIFDAIDSVLKTVSNAATSAQTNALKALDETIQQPITAGAEVLSNDHHDGGFFFGSAVRFDTATNANQGLNYNGDIPLRHLRPGHRLRGFEVRGAQSGAASISAVLRMITKEGVQTNLLTMSNLPVNGGDFTGVLASTFAAITHDVTPETYYCITIWAQCPAGQAGKGVVEFVLPIVERTPTP